MIVDWPVIRHRVAIGWFYARSHFTKALGAIAIGVGVALQHQAEWVVWLSETERGVALRWMGYATLALGIYNQFFPPVRPPPLDPPLPPIAPFSSPQPPFVHPGDTP